MTILFHRTDDVEIVRAIITDARCYRRMANDSAPAREDFPVPIQDGIEYVIATESGVVLAAFLLCESRSGSSCREVHFCILPKAWGAKAKQVARKFLEWVWVNTSLNLLVGYVPSYNPLALRLAERSGFKKCVVRCAVGTRRGNSFDLIQVEAVRPI